VQTEEPPKQSKYKKLTPVFLIILVVGLIGLGLFLKPVLSKTATKSPQANAATTADVPIKLNLYQAQIAISSRGFTPPSVKIKQGDSVAWIRKDGSMHLIVSDSGPATFKGQGALQFNDIYLTTFNTVGTYTYHDQLNPSLKGTVIVE
jgi:plastocyanin